MEFMFRLLYHHHHHHINNEKKLPTAHTDTAHTDIDSNSTVGMTDDL